MSAASRVVNVVLSILVSLLASGLEGQTTFTVTNTNESGPGSFIGALLDVNAGCPAAGARIVFDIPAATDPGCDAATGVCRVQMGASGTGISCPDVEIDGYTQTGAVPNTATDGTFNGVLRIELAGSTGFPVLHDRATIEGIAFAQVQLRFMIRNVFGPGLVNTGAGSVVAGNFFGWRADGLTPLPAFGPAISFGSSTGAAANNILIGGSTPAARNLITTQSSFAGIAFDGGIANTIEGNLFNLNRAGVTTPGATSGSGISFGNSATSGTPLGNVVRGNVIDQTQSSGIDCNAGSNQLFTRNLIFDARLSGSVSAFGIRVAPACNENQAPPVITNVVIAAGGVTVEGTLTSVPSENFRIEFFHNSTPDPENIGRGEQFVGETIVTTNAAGAATFSVVLPAFTRNPSSTATRITTNATSRFSDAVITPDAEPPTITNGPPPNGVVGIVYDFAYTSTGDPAFTVSAGALPPGLALSATGVISGTPLTTGTFTGTVTASNGVSPDATQNFSITIFAPPTITNGPPPNGQVGSSYSFAYTSTGSPSFSLDSGALPPGLVLSAAGVISGTPSTAGTFTGTVRASNGTQPDATQAFSITVTARAVATAAIPTLDFWAMLLLLGTVAIVAVLRMR